MSSSSRGKPMAHGVNPVRNDILIKTWILTLAQGSIWQLESQKSDYLSNGQTVQQCLLRQDLQVVSYLS